MLDSYLQYKSLEMFWEWKQINSIQLASIWKKSQFDTCMQRNIAKID